MVKQDLILSMSEPTNRTIYAKKGDSGRLYDIFIADAEKENGTLRILQPDGSEVTAPAIIQAGGDAYKGDLVTFSALEEVPLTKCEVTLESSQDLHGQSSPYPAGGGKNKLPSKALASYKGMNTSGTWNNNVYTNNGLTYTLTDGVDGTVESIKINGTSGNSYTVFYVGLFDDFSPYAGMILNGAPSGGSGKWELYAQKRTSPYSGWGYDQGNGVTINASASGSTMLAIGIYANKEVSDIVFYPMIRPASVTDPTYAPYSNICPIYPSNGVNLLPNKKYQFTATQVRLGGESAEDWYIPLKAGTYTLSFGRPTIGTNITAYYTPSGGSNTLIGNNGGTFTLAQDTSIGIYLYKSGSLDGDAITWWQLEQGTVASLYVPYQGINLYHVGKNLAYLTYGNQVPSILSGQMVSSNGWSSPFIEVDNTKEYVLSTSDAFARHVLFYGDDYSYLGYATNYSASGYKLSTNANWSNTKYVKLRADATSTETIHQQLELGSTATAYEPYNGTTYPLSLGRSVYGGKVDLVSGKLTVTWGATTFNGAESWQEATSAGITRIRLLSALSDNKQPTANNKLASLISNIYPIKTANQTYGGEMGISVQANSGDIYIYDAMYTTGSAFKTALASNPLHVVYELSTPIEYDLTPTQISTLLGENNVWSSGEVEVAFEYDGLFAQLPEEATEQVGKCIGDVAFTGASSMPFILHILDDVQEETP